MKIFFGHYSPKLTNLFRNMSVTTNKHEAELHGRYIYSSSISCKKLNYLLLSKITNDKYGLHFRYINLVELPLKFEYDQLGK